MVRFALAGMLLIPGAALAVGALLNWRQLRRAKGRILYQLLGERAARSLLFLFGTGLALCGLLTALGFLDLDSEDGLALCRPAWFSRLTGREERPSREERVRASLDSIAAVERRLAERERRRGVASVPPPKRARDTQRAIGPEAPGTDLLGLISPELDLMAGAWRQTQQGLVSDVAGKPSCLEIPVIVSTDYRLELVLERLEGHEHVFIGLPVGDVHMGLVVDHRKAHLAGATARNGDQLRLTSATSLLEDGPNTLVCEVRGNHVRAELNGGAIADWQGDPTRVPPDSVSRGSPPRRLLLGSWASSYAFSSVTLTPLKAVGSDRENGGSQQELAPDPPGSAR